MKIKTVSGIRCGNLLDSRMQSESDESFAQMDINGYQMLIQSTRYVLINLNRGSLGISRRSGYRKINKSKYNE